jgi:trk system potassium uptake protein TrkH
MNYSVIVYILGWIFNIEAATMTLPCLVALIKQESQGFGFLIVMLVSAVIGICLTVKKPSNMKFYVREGFVTVALSWILMSVVGCLPFVINGDIPSFTDALFETVSGFTTTGASILSNVEGLSKCSMFWRSFTHWIGGMGVLVFILAVIPMAGGTRMNLMKAESPGPSVGKLVPKVRQTAMILYIIYIVMTVIEIIFLMAGHMSFFESVTTAFGTAGTGGFGTRNDSMMSMSPYIQWVVTIFMILFGVNFSVYFLLIMRKFDSVLKHEELRAYLIIIAVSAVILFIDLRNIFTDGWERIRQALFQIGSVMTTTGFSSCDFDLWPETSKTVLVFLMFIGACAGSTGGGVKVSRIIIGVKAVLKEITSYIHPRSVKKVKMDGKLIEHEVVRSTNVYFMAYMVIFAISVLLISFENNSMVTNFTAVLATINNIGPGLDGVGPTQNFGGFTPFSKYVLMFDMLAGRLELFPMIMILCPGIWKKKKKQDFEID